MNTQTVIWTTLPNGLKKADQPSSTTKPTLKLSVIISPRLTSDKGTDTLAPSFGDWLDWPSKIGAASFKVQFRDNPTLYSARVVGDAAESGLWQALFKETTFLKSRVFEDFSNRPIRSYSVRDALTSLRTLYSQVARGSDEEVPSVYNSNEQLSRIAQNPAFNNLADYHNPRPSAPTNLTAFPLNSGVSLNWTAVGDATSYIVRRRTPTTGYVVIATGLTSNTYTDAALTNGTPYTYVVTAVSPNGVSKDSNEVTTTPGAVSNLTAETNPAGLGINLSWQAFPGATAYNVKRSDHPGGPYTLIATINPIAFFSDTPIEPNYTDTPPSLNTTYYYVVSVTTAQGEGPNSSEVSAQAILPPIGIHIQTEPSPDPAASTPSPATGEAVSPPSATTAAQVVGVTPPRPVELPSSDEDFKGLVDFHGMFSTLGDYPALMRRLGVVIDLEVDVPDLPNVPTGQSVSGWIKVIPSWQPTFADNRDYSPWTAYLLEEADFGAASHAVFDPTVPQEVNRGQLRLDSGEYTLVEVDVDGAVMKTLNFVNNLDLMVNSGGGTDPNAQDGGFPTIRSGGISIVREKRADQLRARFARSSQHNTRLNTIMSTSPATPAAPTPTPPVEVEFYAEDLLHGYRLDIWDSRSQKWHSLNDRVGTYNFPQAGLQRSLSDEGFVKPGTTQKATDKNTPPSTTDDLNYHESLFRWEGWSLSAPRPGKSINKSPDPAQPPERVTNTAKTQFDLAVSFAATPGTLPKLRYGLNYRVKARAVDLAGNSVGLDPSDLVVAIPTSQSEFAYLRFDPVAAPNLILREPLGQGEAVERLVIRSFNTDPSLDPVATSETNERHVVPPKVSQLMSEVHGQFDGPDGKPRSDPATYQMIKNRDAGTFSPTLTDGSTDPAAPSPIRPEATLSLPYLPDPLSRGATLRGLPHSVPGTVARTVVSQGLVTEQFYDDKAPPEPVTMLDFGFGAVWPDPAAFRLALTEGQQSPQWDAGQRVLTVFLQKAEVNTFKLSSYPDKTDLKLMGVWKWITEAVQKDIALNLHDADALEELTRELIRLTDAAVQGRLWTLTPYRNISLVHAVQQPLGLPLISSLGASRSLGQTFTGLYGKLAVDGPSTAKVDLLASWQEPIDTGSAQPGFVVQSGSAQVFDFPIYLDGTAVIQGGLAVAQYDPDQKALLLQGGPVVGGNSLHHAFGDTKHRQVSYQLVSTTRFREYFPPAIANDPTRITRTGPAFELDIPSSARPAPPRPLYVLPTFGWERQSDTNVIVSERQGKGLRIYLDRPWFSSGEGELLGAVVWPGSGSNIPADQFESLREHYHALISQWAADPIWPGGAIHSTLGSGAFTGNLAQGTALSLDEDSSISVDVVGYGVKFDSDRGLWYTDVELDPRRFGSINEAYFPFVRLALVRYQPHSVPDAHLSRVVLADFIQLAPDRSVIVTYDPYASNVLNLTVSGRSATTRPGPNGQPLTNSVEVSLEKRLPTVRGDFGWAVDPTITPVPADTAGSAEILWSGTLTLPVGYDPKHYRLVIKEFEAFSSDSAPRGPVVIPGAGIPSMVARRLVFAEIIGLGPSSNFTGSLDFALLTLQNLHLNGSEVGGRVGVGGDATLEASTLGTALSNSSGSRDDLVVGGNLTINAGQIPNGNVVYGLTQSIKDLSLPNGTVRQQTDPLELSDLRDFVTSIGDEWATLTVNGATDAPDTSGSGTNLAVHLTGSDPTQNVFSLAAGLLERTHSLQITAPASSTVVVNVAGVQPTVLNVLFSLDGPVPAQVVYNFFEAQGLTINADSLPGSVWAAHAAVNFLNGNVAGLVVADSVTGHLTVSNGSFSGQLPL